MTAPDLTPSPESPSCLARITMWFSVHRVLPGLLRWFSILASFSLFSWQPPE